MAPFCAELETPATSLALATSDETFALSAVLPPLPVWDLFELAAVEASLRLELDSAEVELFDSDIEALGVFITELSKLLVGLKYLISVTGRVTFVFLVRTSGDCDTLGAFIASGDLLGFGRFRGFGKFVALSSFFGGTGSVTEIDIINVYI